MTTAEITLTQTDLRRIDKLAKEAGRTPKAMLKFVLRDGFAETERVVAAVRCGRAAAAEGKTTLHGDVMQQARATVARHAAKQKAA